MQADTSLTYSSPKWQETLKSFTPIKDNISKLALEPYPDVKVLAAFAKLAYSDCAGKLSLPKGWQLLTTAQNNSWGNGYFGCAVWNPSEQQVVIAHRGTNPKKMGPLYADGKGVYFNKYTEHMLTAVTFSDELKEAIVRTNKQHGSRLVLSLSGHSLGAWLAGVTTMTVKHLKREGNGFCRNTTPDEGLQAHTLALDSPGVEDMLIKISRDYDVRYDRSMCTNQLDITTFFAAPNLVNSTGFHVGYLHQILTERIALPSDSEEPTLLTNIDTHNIDKFIDAFKDGKEAYVVKNWPQGFSERKYYHGLEMFSNSYILNLDIVQVSTMSSSGSHRNTQPIEGNSDNMHVKEIPTLQYNTVPSSGNTCNLGVFSGEEFNFIKNWNAFQGNTLIKLTKIQKFTNQQKLKKLEFPLFEIDTRRNTITCKTKEHLGKVIGQTKQLLRWFPEEIMEAVNKQNRSIKSAPLYLAGQAYLRTLPVIQNCEDTLGLETFLESSEQRVLQVETSDYKFEAARLYNILKQIKNISLEAKYLKKNCHTFLCWNDMDNIAKNIDIEGLKENYITNDNLLVLEFASSTNHLLSNCELLTTLLINIKTCSQKKLVIILRQSIDSQLFMDYNLTVVTNPAKVFELSDLALTSRKEILVRDAIAIGEETLNLNTFLGNYYTTNDEQIRTKINKLISPILKYLATDHHYIFKIPNKLPRLCELEALYSKGNKRVSKEKLIALLNRTGADGPLIVISDPEQLSQDYWEEVAEDTRRRIFTSNEGGHDLFLEKCREKSTKLLYWFHLCPEGFTLGEVYNSSLYVPRKFHTRFIIKSLEEFVRYSGNKDVFIFHNVEDKLSLIGPFNLSSEAVGLFISKDHFKILSNSKELNTDDEIKGESLNKHFFVLLKIKGNPCLVWQYSHGSLDGLRPFITRDYSDPIDESDFSNTRKKLIIVADDPGTGKTTSLTRMSELIRDFWVLRINHNHLTAVDKLPSKLNLHSVTKCLLCASGLPTNDDFLRSLLQHCLESDRSRQICVLVDAFDEITEDKTKFKMIELLKYLKNFTQCKTVVTTRVYPQEGLENELAEFSTELAKITEREQDNYMVNSWLPHLALELAEYGEPEKGRLRQFAKALRRAVVEVLGEDAASFMGIPLQIRMLTEVFLQQVILSVVSPEQEHNLCKITNLFDLYKQFIGVKKTIYFDQKNIFSKGLPLSLLNDMVTNIMERHCVLAFQSYDPKFAEDYFTKQVQNVSDQGLKDVSRLGLIRFNSDGTFSFIHRTFAEYFCADFFVKWLREGRQTNENDLPVKNKLCSILLNTNYFTIRKFIETQLDISLPIPSVALENNPIIYQSWFKHRQLFFNDHYKTPLHISAEEQNRHIVAVLLSGPSSRTSEEAYISFIAARDKAGRTALNIALGNRNRNIVKQIMENVKSCSYESLLKLMLATFINVGGDRGDNLFREYCSNIQPSTSANTALIRTEQIREQITPFTTALRKDDYRSVQKIFDGMESDTERAHLLIAINNQGDTAINLAASKKDHKFFKLFAEKGVCVSYDKHEQNPLHRASEAGYITIVIFLLNQSKEIYDNIKTVNSGNHHGEEVTEFKYAGKHSMYFSINSKRGDGSTALQLAALGGHYDIVWELLEKGADVYTRTSNGSTALMSAASNGHFEVVELLLLNGADLNARNVNGASALLLATYNGHLDIVRKLLEKGADIHARNNDGWTALIQAASEGHLEVVKLLLLNGADLNSRTELSNPALLLAAYNGHLEIVRKLLEKGADIHARNNDGWTALIQAASEGHLDVVELLLLNGADLNSQTELGYTALFRAAHKGDHDTVRKLLEKGADIHIRDANGCTALISAVAVGYREVVELLLLNGANVNSQDVDGISAILLAAYNGYFDLVQKLLQHGADINTRDNNRCTALISTAAGGHSKVVELLLLNGADVNSKNIDGSSALLLAAFNGHYDIVQNLLQHGADIHTRNNNGWTMLISTAAGRHSEVVELLLLKGADLNSQDVDGNSALLLAAFNGQYVVVQKLLQHGANVHTTNNNGWTALMQAANEGHPQVIELLLLNGADLNTRDVDGKSALLLAAINGHYDTVRILLEKGADIHTKDTTTCWTAFNCAAGYGHLDVAQLLLLNGADLNSRDKDGDTALLQAAANGHTDIVILLLQRGVDINSQNDDGKTALSWAAHEGRVDVVKVFLQNKADVFCKDKDGKVALCWAEEKGHQEVVDLLCKHHRKPN